MVKKGGGHAGFDFTKLDHNGNELPASAKEWACVQDNVTGLMWEGKTNDGGLHDWDWTYSWYEPDVSKSGGYAGQQNGGNCGKTSDCDTHAYVQAVNADGWCGHNDWRMPTVDELQGIANLDGQVPAIERAYFPDTRPWWGDVYWSSSSSANLSVSVWYMDFLNGESGQSLKISGREYVRLVRGGQQ